MEVVHKVMIGGSRKAVIRETKTFLWYEELAPASVCTQICHDEDLSLLVTHLPRKLKVVREVVDTLGGPKAYVRPKQVLHIAHTGKVNIEILITLI